MYRESLPEDGVRLQSDPVPEEPTPAPPRATTALAAPGPRHVRAVPTTAEVKVERALELFNGSGTSARGSPARSGSRG